MNDTNNLGPLANLVGQWYGNKGKDYFPTPGNGPKITSQYTELMTFTPIAPVQNGPQILYGVQYTTVLTGTEYIEQQHQESGYYLWEPTTKTIIKTFAIPRGEAIMAKGGLFIPLEPGIPTQTDASKEVNELFSKSNLDVSENGEVIYLTASAEDPSYGILNTPFLDKNFDIIEFAAIMSISTVNQQQKDPYDPSKTIEVPRLQLNYFECSALKYSESGAKEYHTDMNTLWKQV